MIENLYHDGFTGHKTSRPSIKLNRVYFLLIPQQERVLGGAGRDMVPANEPRSAGVQARRAQRAPAR